MIAALDENRLIGAGSGIPWQLPRDSRHFRDYTEGKAMLLGRRTFEEMAGWFTTQRPLVMTRSADYAPAHLPAGFCAVGSVVAGIEQARATGEAELVISGGAQIYAQGLPFAEELILTEIHAAFEGSEYFPEFRLAEWDQIVRESFEADAENAHAMSFVTYRRRECATLGVGWDGLI